MGICGNPLTRCAFDFKNTVSVSYISPSQFTAAPLGAPSPCSCGHVREEMELKEREEAKLKLIMPLGYRRCVHILLAISKV